MYGKRKFGSFKGYGAGAKRPYRSTWRKTSRKGFYRRGKGGRTYKYTHTRHTGKFKGRMYRRVRRGGKWYRRYKTAASKKLTGVRHKHVEPFDAKVDRYHSKHKVQLTGRMHWPADSVECVGSMFSADKLVGFPPVSFLNDPATVSSLMTSSYNTVTSGYGLQTLETRYRYMYVSSVSVDCKFTRQDQADDNSTDFCLIPINVSQAEEWKAIGDHKVANGNFIPPGASSNTSWLNGKNYPYRRQTSLTGAVGGKQWAHINQHFEAKHFQPMDFPKGGDSFWNIMDTSGAGPLSASIRPWYISILLFNKGVNETFLDFDFTVTYFCTWFQLLMPSLLTTRKMYTMDEYMKLLEEKQKNVVTRDQLKLLEAKRAELKELKDEKNDDEEDEAEFHKAMSLASISSPPRPAPPTTPPAPGTTVKRTESMGSKQLIAMMKAGVKPPT